jgi:hypothetical protein
MRAEEFWRSLEEADPAMARSGYTRRGRYKSSVPYPSKEELIERMKEYKMRGFSINAIMLHTGFTRKHVLKILGEL